MMFAQSTEKPMFKYVKFFLKLIQAHLIKIDIYYKWAHSIDIKYIAKINEWAKEMLLKSTANVIKWAY